MKRMSWRIAGVLATSLCTIGFMANAVWAQPKNGLTDQSRVAPQAVAKTTVTVGYPPGDMPNYIFPMIAPASDTPADIFWFIEQFWRPLYFFGQGAGSGFNESLSLAYPPTWSNGGKTATIKLKNWKWSDGQPITTRDVEFWINLLKADKSGYANYISGNFPDNVSSFKYLSPTTMQITFNAAYNQNWLLYNQLSVIFVAPQHAWDKTSATGKIGDYDLTTAGAQAVYKYLNGQSLNVTGYTSSPLWQVVDGPYHLVSYQPNSEVTIAPNPNYSGPVKSHISTIQFLNFTSDEAEYLDVLSGKIDYGYVPFADMPSVGRVKSLGYRVEPWPQGGMNYAVYNYSNPVEGPLFKQLYIREAIQSLVDQPAYIRVALYGDGVPRTPCRSSLVS